jgi:membrane protein DedA with SNARE-associated domain
LDFFTTFVERFGYFAVAAFVTLEGFGVPLPGETAVVTAAAFAAQGSLSIVGVVLSAVFGTVVGGSGGYWIGRVGGRGLLHRYGYIIRLSPERLHRTEQFFLRHGMMTVFFARFVALLRIFGCIFAGVAEMPFPAFSVVNLLGGVVWAVAFSTLGYVFGRNLPLLEDYLTEISITISGLLTVGLFIYWVRRRKKRPDQVGTHDSSL